MGGGTPAALEGLEESRVRERLEGHELAGRAGWQTVRPGAPETPDSPTASRFHGDLSPALQLLCGPPPHPTNAPPLFAALAPALCVLTPFVKDLNII